MNKSNHYYICLRKLLEIFKNPENKDSIQEDLAKYWIKLDKDQVEKLQNFTEYIEDLRKAYNIKEENLD